VISGGTDVEPKNYGQEQEAEAHKQNKFRFRDWLISILLFMLRLLTQQKRSQGYDPQRDSMEKSLIEYALRRGLPVLGICRGAQLLNIVTGGSLHQHITEFYSEEPHVRSLLPRKRIVLERDTKIASLIQEGTRFVNALHDQAIDQLGEGMMVTARDLAGVVQAIEHSVDDFVLGVQWHPEYLPQIQSQQRIFAGLVASAKQKRRTKFGAPDD
jgi:putative glutamine amidotransferase